MAKRVKTAPRKQPSQARAQETVDAILAATARLMVTEGYDKMSTNRIAAAAGVSIGSLYQYFPSKEAIVAALIEQHACEMGETSRAMLAVDALLHELTHPVLARRSTERVIDELVRLAVGYLRS